MQMIGGNGRNQFRQYAGQNAGNLNGSNDVQNVRNQVAQNPRIQNIGNQNGLIGVQRNGIQNQIGNGNLVAARAEGNAAGPNGNQIRMIMRLSLRILVWNKNVGNQVAQNLRVQNVGNQNGLVGVQGNGNQNQIENGNIVAVYAEGNAAGHNGNQIRCYNCRG
nr:hypothetical protein [Tanacetum cinerariifolium]